MCGLRSGAAVGKDAELVALWVGKHDPALIALADVREELTPTRGDLRAGMPVALAAAATLVRPGSWQWFTSGAVANYALTPQGWQSILTGTDTPK